MTDTKILTKAIEKVLESGHKIEGLSVMSIPSYISYLGKEAIIFSHDFAKAFWGEGKKLEPNHWIFDGDKEGNLKRWQHHLQQMVLEENPIKYIEKFL